MSCPTIIEIFKELLRLQRETEWVEFKVNNFKPYDIGEYISALSNAACLDNKKFAYLVYGVDDKTHKPIGTKFKPKETKVGNQELENWLITQLKPQIDFKIFEFQYEENHIVVFRIDPTYRGPVSFRNEEYIRVGTYKKKLKDHREKEKKIWGRCQQNSFEEEIALKNVKAEEVLNLLEYKTYFNLTGTQIPKEPKTIIDKLEEEGVLTKYRRNYHITNLGAVLFANNLNDFKALRRKSIRVILYSGRDRIASKMEAPFDEGYAPCFTKLIDYLSTILPSNEEIERDLRRIVPVYPPTAIRELVANAMIHQDFTEIGTSPMIEIFEDRIEITNPGKPLISTLRFIDHSPQSRNEKLAYLMRRMNICEERGTGIDKVITSIELFQLPPPKFEEGTSFLRATLYTPKTLTAMGKQDRIRATYQHCVIKYLSGETMSNQSLRKRLKIKKTSYSLASGIISDTIQGGLIKPEDETSTSKKFARYIPFWA